MLPLVCTGVSAILSAGCHPTEIVNAVAPTYGRMFADPKSSRLPGDIISVDVWVTTAASVDDSEGATLVDVPVDFTVTDPTVVRIVGPSRVLTARPDLLGQAVARVQVEFLKEGTTTLNASVAGATYKDRLLGTTNSVSAAIQLSAYRPTSILLRPASPIFVESRAVDFFVDPTLLSSSGVSIGYGTFKWSCPTGESVVALSDGRKCNDTMASTKFVPQIVGTATFRVSVADALYARFPIFSDLQVTVTNPVARIDLAAAALSVGSAVSVTATLRDAAGVVLPATLRHNVLPSTVIEKLTWSSSDESVATVDQKGVVTGKAADTVTITARYTDLRGDSRPFPVFASGSIKFAVGPTTNVVTPEPSAFSMVVGASRAVFATVRDAAGKEIFTPITWLSRDVSIASIGGAGGFTSVQALSTGPVTTTPSTTVQILARSAGAQGVLTVTVYRKVASIVLTPMTASLRTGQTVRLVPTLLDGSGNVVPTIATKLTWTAQDPTNATVDTSGLVTAAAPNALPARIRVSEGGGASAVADITVLPPASTVSVTISNATSTRPLNPSEALAVGTSAQLVATLKDASGIVINDALTFTTSSSAIASVTTTGANTATIAAVAAGTATIRIARTSDPSSFLSATFVVSGGTGGLATRIVITSTPASATTAAGGTVTFIARALDAAGLTASDCPVGWATDASRVASIGTSGVATGVGAGTTAVRAYCTDHGTISAAARIIVTDPTGVTQVNITPRFVYLAPGGSSQLFAASLLPTAASTAIDWQLLQSPAGVLTSTPSGINNANVTIALPASMTTLVAGGARIVARAGGQSDTSWVTYGNAGSIKGTVVSNSGQYLGGSTAIATPSAGGASVISGLNNEGIFYLTGLPAGTYTVTVSQQGNPIDQRFTNVVVTAGGTTQVTLVPFP